MILQDSVCYESNPNPSLSGFRKTIRSRVSLVLSAVWSVVCYVKEARDQAALRAQLGKLSITQLRDIGYDDPQVQVRSLGRYLENEVVKKECCMHCLGGLSGTPWHH